MEKREHIVFIDYIRVVACFLVMLVHASENFYIGSDGMSLVANETNRFWVAFYDGGVARTCVPLFMIVSSFLLVPMRPGVSMGAFYKRRFLRILPPMVIFLILSSVLPLLWGGMTWEQSLTDLKNLPFTFPSMAGHLWFMYPLISLYIIIPVVSPWLEKASSREGLIFLCFFVLSTFMPWIQRFVSPDLWCVCSWNQFHALWYCSGYLGYLVMAHYIHYHINWSTSKRIKVGTVCFLLGAIFTAWAFWIKAVPGQSNEVPAVEWAWAFCTPSVLCASFGAFLLFTCIPQTKSPKLIKEIARLSFGMYLMHIFFLNPISSLVIGGDTANPLLPIWLAIPTIAVLTYVCTVIVSKLISLVPGSKWIIG